MRARTSPETQLMVLGASTNDARASSRAQAQALIDAIDWSALEARLSEQRLLALLGERIIELADGRAPARFFAATQGAIEAGCTQESTLELITIQLVDALRTAGIRSLPIKGPTLARAIYRDCGRRPSADIDLLVASEDLPGAVEIAEHLGYRDEEGVAARAELPRLHLTLTRESLPPLELHWRVHWYESRFSRDLLFRSSSGDLIPRATRSDELTSLLLFYERDGFVGLRLACDLAAWWDRFGAELEPGTIEAVIARYPELARALVAAAVVAQRVVAFPGYELIGGNRRLERRVRTATRLANPEAHGTLKQRGADTWLIDWLLTPPGGRRECIRRQLSAPGDSVLRRHGRLGSLNRGVRLLRRYAIALARVAYDQALARNYRVTSRP